MLNVAAAPLQGRQYAEDYRRALELARSLDNQPGDRVSAEGIVDTVDLRAVLRDDRTFVEERVETDGFRQTRSYQDGLWHKKLLVKEEAGREGQPLITRTLMVDQASGAQSVVDEVFGG